MNLLCLCIGACMMKLFTLHRRFDLMAQLKKVIEADMGEDSFKYGVQYALEQIEKN